MRRTAALSGLLCLCILAAGHAEQLGGAAADLHEAAARLAAGDEAAALQRTLDAAAAIAQTLPLGIARAELVRQPTLAYAADLPRADSHYAAGEPILVYLEPVGYRFDTADGTVFFGFALDVALLDKKGAAVARRRDFGSWTFRSRRPSLEAFVSLAIATSGLSPGDYRLELTLRDLVDPSARATAALPVTLLESASAQRAPHEEERVAGPWVRPQAASVSPAAPTAATSSR